MNRTTICRKDLMNTLNNNIFKKIFSALELPMNSDETLNMEMLSKLIEYELSIGVEGFYCMGSSGEALLLSLEERKNALEDVYKRQIIKSSHPHSSPQSYIIHYYGIR